MKPRLVIDTNIILLDANNIITLAKDYIVVIPEIVVQELDSKKTDMGELGFQARSFGRLIASGTPTITTKNALTVATITLNNNKIEIISIPVYPINYNNDRKIIYIAEQVQKIYGPITFMSNDVACRIRAMANNISAIDLKEVEKTEYQFIKHLNVTSALFSTLHNRSISEVDTSHELENYNYVFHDVETGQSKLAIISQGIIDILGKTTENELRKQDVNPCNFEQLLLSRAIQHPDIDIILSEAKAGSGKTIVAISNAMKLVKQNNAYDSIVYVRASIDDVDSTEAVGFLSGNIEKFEVYFHPLYDSIEHIVRTRFKRSKGKTSDYEAMIQNKIPEFINSYNISTLTGLGLRGRTITNSIVIIDEVQGQSKASLQKMLTRIGKDCKVIIIGSQRQIDNPYVNKFNNGFSVLLNETTKPQSLVRLHAVTLSKVVRSPLAEWSEDVFESHKGQQ